MSTPHIKIYTSTWCPFCVQAKHLLQSKGVSFEELNVDTDPSLRAKMMQESGRHTVPQIWIGETHVGGCDDLYALEKQQDLDKLLNA